MANSLRDKINLAFATAVGMLLLISVISFASTLGLLRSAEGRRDAEEMVTGLEAVLASLNAAEGAQRGYIITADSAHIPRYLASVGNATAEINQLQELAGVRPAVAPLVDSLRALVNFRVRKFEDRLAIYHTRGIGALAKELQGDPEDARISEMAQQIKAVIRKDLDAHANRAAKWGRTALGVIALGGVAAVLFLSLSTLVIHRESQARADAYSELREEQVRHAQFLETLPLGVFVIHADGLPAYSNRYARDMFGLGLDSDVNARANFAYLAGTGDAYPPEKLPSVRALRGEASTVEDMELQHEGRRIPLRVSAAPIYASDGTITSAIAVFTDITERRAVEQMKDELISVVSHELRTPLTSIRGALGLVGSGRLGELNDQGKRMIEIAVTDTDRLVRLINDMLDIERMQSGRIEMHKTTCNAEDLALQAIESVRALAHKADVEISLDAERVPVWCDADRIVQTLTNLIGNAIKYSPAQEIVQVGVHAREDQVVFRVSDSGRGIPEDKIETIFERFQQVDASDAREKGGAGLGLAISRNIVIQHGGHIWAESDGATGSTFCFTLPRLMTHAEDRAEGTASGAILIVEDDANLASVLSAQFEAAGMRSVRAANGTEAIRIAEANKPDLLVMDLMLPKRDGFDVVDWLRQHEYLRHLPVVVYTALELDERDKLRLTLGPTEFMTKSKERPEEVTSRVAALLNDSRTSPEHDQNDSHHR